ncbi:DUF3054 domain-containing protein [Micrococcus sp. FDAARGOS_333]|uniref:DUF3054 domain-containing protein n=1 Tax=Micrococcus sp. FDAARGOS_333 TaxID=1930558 RepID=UPI000B4E09BC|nr:DUF3054 domain-containing protein [Micrococcus sp. FDAARGOS_333]PNL18034.1 DUF3054 domain-containing protein [Micrococcus sp. FDAARGOS_333]
MNRAVDTADTTHRPHPHAQRALPGWTIPVVLLIDIVLVTVFVAIGQREHTTQNGFLGLLVTASPFLIGLLASSFGFCWTRAHRWLQVWPAGIGVWLGTLTLGMLLRVAFDQGGAPLPFVLVAAGSLALFLLGRRALTGLLLRHR